MVISWADCVPGGQSRVTIPNGATQMSVLLVLAERLTSAARTDGALLRSVAENRDADALAELFRRYARTVRAVAADISPADTDDVVQAAFVLLADRAGALAGRESAAGWLFQVARRLALKARTAGARRRKRESRVPTRSPDR